MKRLGVSLPTPGAGLTPAIKFARTHLYTWVVSGTVRVKCFDQEHNAMSPTRAWTRTAWSGDKCTEYEATTTPTTTLNDNSAQKIVFKLFEQLDEHMVFIFLTVLYLSLVFHNFKFLFSRILDFDAILMIKSFNNVQVCWIFVFFLELAISREVFRALMQFRK